jgi:hypothetical protein
MRGFPECAIAPLGRSHSSVAGGAQPEVARLKNVFAYAKKFLLHGAIMEKKTKHQGGPRRPGYIEPSRRGKVPIFVHPETAAKIRAEAKSNNITPDELLSKQYRKTAKPQPRNG